MEMIIGAHSIIYSKDPDADRAFLRDALRLTNVDAGEGWLIFGLPPAEVAVHPSENNDVHEFYLMCEGRRLRPGPQIGLGNDDSSNLDRRGKARRLSTAPRASQGDASPSVGHKDC